MLSVVDLPVTFDRIADFRFVRLLGSGSFAQTFEAVRGEEHFAVKVLNELPASVEAREAETGQRLPQEQRYELNGQAPLQITREVGLIVDPSLHAAMFGC